MAAIWRALTVKEAETAEGHEDARLRGRTYAIPFEDVWSAARALASVGMRGWRMVSADDDEGVIQVEATGMLRRSRVDDVVIRVTLDRNAQTRVDARAAAREGRGDLGRNARSIGRFFRALDRAVVEARRHRLHPDAPASGKRRRGSA